jgi:serine/threonine-protein kinase
MVLQCAQALAATHGLGLLHRDIKPDNIFALAAPGGLAFKLLDFGLAKEMAVDGSLTQTGVLMGTPLYMSPEQVRGAAMDGRSDLYALAAVAYEALSGRRLVQSEALTDILVEVVQGRPAPLGDLVQGLPSAAARAFDAALEKDPRLRPPSIPEWAEGLAASLGTMAGEPGWPTDPGDLMAGQRLSSSGSRPRLDAPPTQGVPRTK